MATTVGGKKMMPKTAPPATKPAAAAARATAAPARRAASAVGLSTGRPAAAAPAPAPAAPVQPELPMEAEPEPTPTPDVLADGSACDLARQSLLWHARLIGHTLDLDEETLAEICREVATEISGYPE